MVLRKQMFRLLLFLLIAFSITSRVTSSYDSSSVENEFRLTENQTNLFDIFMELTSHSIPIERNLSSIITLINIGSPGNVSVYLDYMIRDTSGNMLYVEQEERSLATQTEFIREFATHALQPGDYLLTVQLTYLGQKEPAVTESPFTILRLRESPPWSALPFLYGILLLAILAILTHRIVLFYRKEPLSKERTNTVLAWKFEP